jgi:hypothetical protein
VYIAFAGVALKYYYATPSTAPTEPPHEGEAQEEDDKANLDSAAAR